MTRPAIQVEIGPPVRGMNTCDDPKALRPGEVVQLTNARPGNPPEVRRGCTGVLIEGSAAWEFIPPGAAYNTLVGNRVIVWVQVTGTAEFKLLSIPEGTDGTDVDTVFEVTLFQPMFTMVPLHGGMYNFINATAGFGSRVVEQDGTTVRFGAFPTSPSHRGGITVQGGGVGVFPIGKHYGYAFTGVRRNDSSAFEAGGTPEDIILPPGIPASYRPKTTVAYLPGVVEGVETFANRKAIEIVDDTVHTEYFTRLNIAEDNAYTNLMRMGATHVRVYRSLGQDTADGALGATKYFLVDLPMGTLMKTAAPADVDTTENTIEITSHGFVTGDEVYYGGNIGGLVTGTKYYVIRVDAALFRLAASYADAVAETALSLTSQGTGTHRFIKSWEDVTGDDVLALSGDTFLTVSDYSVPPRADYVEFVKDRLWIQSGGFLYYSEAPGGCGGVPLELAYAQPQKWATWFKPLLYFFDIDSASAEGARGLARLGNDLYIFKESKTFAIFGGDPTAGSPPQEISTTVGCAFPHTLTKCDTKSRYGNVILFLSNEGPMIIEEGGRMRPFAEFKIKELWPEKSIELYGDLKDEWAWIKNHCVARFWRNEWWVMYQNKAGTSRIFAYYFNPESAIDPSAPSGAYEVKMA